MQQLLKFIWIIEKCEMHNGWPINSIFIFYYENLIIKTAKALCYFFISLTKCLTVLNWKLKLFALKRDIRDYCNGNLSLNNKYYNLKKRKILPKNSYTLFHTQIHPVYYATRAIIEWIAWNSFTHRDEKYLILALVIYDI